MRFPKRSATLLAGCLVLAACDEPLDFDLRGNVGGFSTASAARAATAARPAPDARGIISYPNYQVAVAQRGDTVTSLAQRIGSEPEALARFNGIDPAVPLREGEIIALPSRVAEPAPGTPGAIDITTLAGDAIDSAPSTPPVTTASLEPAIAPPVQSDTPGEPIRHRVSRGETAYSIARLYRVPVRALADWNGLGADFAIREGQYLLIPVANAAPPVETAAVAIVAEPGQGSPTPTPPSAATPLPREEVAAANTPVQPPRVNVGTPSRANARMGMPVEGQIIRDYNKGRNDGIDIAAAPGTSVRAAADGTVAAITSDADQVPIVVVRHPDNVLTVYANVDGISVKKGDSVSRGQKIAELRAGDDAYLHFEVREGFDSVDPTPYLN